MIRPPAAVSDPSGKAAELAPSTQKIVNVPPPKLPPAWIAYSPGARVKTSLPSAVRSIEIFVSLGMMIGVIN